VPQSPCPQPLCHARRQALVAGTSSSQRHLTTVATTTQPECSCVLLGVYVPIGGGGDTRLVDEIQPLLLGRSFLDLRTAPQCLASTLLRRCSEGEGKSPLDPDVCSSRGIQHDPPYMVALPSWQMCDAPAGRAPLHDAKTMGGSW
jgi:hypothetical protein